MKTYDLEVPYAVITDTSLSYPARVVLGKITQLCRCNAGNCSLSNASLADQTGLHPRSIERFIAELRVKNRITQVVGKGNRRVIHLVSPQEAILGPQAVVQDFVALTPVAESPRGCYRSVVVNNFLVLAEELTADLHPEGKDAEEDAVRMKGNGKLPWIGEGMYQEHPEIPVALYTRHDDSTCQLVIDTVCDLRPELREHPDYALQVGLQHILTTPKMYRFGMLWRMYDRQRIVKLHTLSLHNDSRDEQAGVMIHEALMGWMPPAYEELPAPVALTPRPAITLAERRKKKEHS